MKASEYYFEGKSGWKFLQTISLHCRYTLTDSTVLLILGLYLYGIMNFFTLGSMLEYQSFMAIPVYSYITCGKFTNIEVGELVKNCTINLLPNHDDHSVMTWLLGTCLVGHTLARWPFFLQKWQVTSLNLHTGARCGPPQVGVVVLEVGGFLSLPAPVVADVEKSTVELLEPFLRILELVSAASTA